MRFLKPLIFFILVTPAFVFPVIVLDDVMCREEQRRIGIYCLNHKQKRALEIWLNQNFVLRSDVEKKHENLYLSENIGSGKRLILSNGDVYDVFEDDIEKASLWVTPFPLKIVPTKDPDFPYKILNLNTGISVRVKIVEDD